jgi:hypothetical protein
MKLINLKLRTTQTISSKLAFVKDIKVDTGFGLKESKCDITDVLVNADGEWVTLSFPKHFYERKNYYKNQYGVEMKGFFQEKLASILDGEIVKNETIEKFEQFIETVDKTDAVALDIFNNLLPLLSKYPFELKDSLRELKKDEQTNT